MCGISGLRSVNIDKIEREGLLERSLDLLRHRGPDSKGVESLKHTSFGHARLSIIDLDGGAQPFVDSEKNQILTFNGEIYNYVELREVLRGKGYRFRTRSDTEVLFRAYQHWGVDVVHHLNGMYAFAIYDSNLDELFMARDPFGQKPLFYFESDQMFAFASEIAPLKSLTSTHNLDMGVVAAFLVCESWAGPETLEQSIKKVLPGHFVRWKDGRTETSSYFDFSKKVNYTPNRSQIEAGIEESVNISLRSDVPLAVLLSGGIDSSLVLAEAIKHKNAQDIQTLTIKNPDITFDESLPAALTAKHFGTRHTELKFQFPEMAQIAREILPKLDEPIADPGFLPKYYICRHLSQTGKLALTGDGGDELFYGYEIFKAFRFSTYLDYLPAWVKKNFFSAVAEKLTPGHGYMTTTLKAKRFLAGMSNEPIYRNVDWAGSYGFQNLENGLMSKDLSAAGISRVKGLYQKHFEMEDAPHSLEAFAHLYQKTFLPEYVLKNSDRASMLSGVELRAPLLDPRLFEMAQALPDSEKLSGFETKSILKKIANDRLPAHLKNRRKMGFTAPVGHLLCNELKSDFLETFSVENCRLTDLFNRKFVMERFQAHLSGRDSLHKLLWTSYILQKWLLNRGR